MESITRFGQPFASVPYRVHEGNRRFAESSARSRGFKFATISGVTAYLSKAEQIIVPESGQGSLGPSLTPVGQAYEDYRNHPLFTDTMEKYLGALFHHQPRFEFPRLWNTKAETLKEFVDKCPDGHTWEATWSCWQSARQASVDGHKRQCGICAACMLRRQSVHAAGLTERKEKISTCPPSRRARRRASTRLPERFASTLSQAPYTSIILLRFARRPPVAARSLCVRFNSADREDCPKRTLKRNSIACSINMNMNGRLL